MKNDKGYSLFEVLMAIFILSIAGLIIVTGLMSVLRILNQANTVKNQSDMLISIAEKTNVKFDKKVKVESKKLKGYTISNDKGNTVSNTLRITNYAFEKEGLVSFKAPRTTLNPTVLDLFPNIKDDAQSVLKKASEDIKNVIDGFPYTSVFKNYNYSMKFPTELLPKRFNKETHYINVFFPWEYNDRLNNNSVIHGGTLIYLTKYASITESTNTEILHIVYDYDNDIWYYTDSDDYVISYDYEQKFLLGIPCLTYRGNGVDDWQSLKKLLEGWKTLDIESVYDANNPDLAWR